MTKTLSIGERVRYKQDGSRWRQNAFPGTVKGSTSCGTYIRVLSDNSGATINKFPENVLRETDYIKRLIAGDL